MTIQDAIDRMVEIRIKLQVLQKEYEGLRDLLSGKTATTPIVEVSMQNGKLTPQQIAKKKYMKRWRAKQNVKEGAKRRWASYTPEERKARVAHLHEAKRKLKAAREVR